MSAESVQHLRKELKQWESAFYVVHQRKPGKNDIETAPQEIKDKYHLYFQEKKKINREVDDSLLSPERQPNAASDVWGKEFNKTPATKSSSETASPIVTPAASLDKLGAKLFQNFSRNSPAVRPKGIFKKPVDSSGPDSQRTVTDESSTQFQVCENTEKRGMSNSNITALAVEGFGAVTRSDESFIKKQDPNLDEDFIVKGELFKSAGKLFTPKSGQSTLLKHQITSKPRLSFLSHMPVCSEVDDSSGEKINIQDSCEMSGLESTEFNSSAIPSDAVCVNDSDQPSADSQSISRTGSLMGKGKTHLSKNNYAVNFKSKELEKRRNRNAEYSTCSQYLSEELKKNNNDCDSYENFSTEDFNFDESINSGSRSIPEISQHIPEDSRVSNESSRPRRSGKCSGNSYYGDSLVSPTLASFHSAQNLSSEENDTPEIKAIQKTSSSQISGKTTRKRTRKTLPAKRESTSEATNYSSTLEEFSDGNSTLSVDANAAVKKKTGQGRKKKILTVSGGCPDGIGNISSVHDSTDTSASARKVGERKRKRSLEVQVGWSGDGMEENGSISTLNVSEEPKDFPAEDEPAVNSGASCKPRKQTASKRTAASMNENYVCLNMKRKGYRRKGAGMTGPQLKRKLWKAKMASRSQSFGSNKCFKCGQEGHWANKCTGKPKDSQNWNPHNVDQAPVQESDFPSLREAAMMGRGIKDKGDDKKNADDITDIEATIVRENWNPAEPPRTTPALADHITDFQKEMYKGLSVFGFSSFRPGQENSIGRVLQGLSTLVVLSTGGGKSLCYQLPAYLYAKHLGAVTLVISPLVSLMEDQITGLPPGVVGACLHSNMSLAQREGVISSLREGKVHFLLVSPEAIVERGGAGNGSFPPPSRMPPIAFACIDEAHCLSEWSHNFRPSYLRLCKVLRKRYNVTCFLGLTATATRSTAKDVARHLGIHDPESATIRGAAVPSNLVLSASRDENKDEALISLLKGNRFNSCESILIYCSRREQTERVATLIRTSMQTSVDLNDSYQPAAKKPKTSKKVTFDPKIWNAESYHAGLTASKRRTVQKSFMSGKLRVVVATVAFGMGLDKANVRAVIHYNMAKSFESYVQEIGRAGRDGQPSHCHAFLDSQGKDLCELRRHIYGNGVDRVSLKRFLAKVFKPCRCREIFDKTHVKLTESHPSSPEERDLDPNQSDTPMDGICGAHERALSIQETVQMMDMREEGITTLLSYLELHPESFVENLNHVYTRCSIKCYGGARQLMSLAKKCPPVAVVIARQKLEGKSFSDCSQLDFDVIDVCDSMGWDSGTVKRELLSLQWESGPSGARKTGVCVELSDLAFHFRSRGDLTANQMDRVLDFLYLRTQQQENAELRQLTQLSEALTSVSHKNYWMCSDEVDVERSDRLKEMLRKYFDGEDTGTAEEEEESAGSVAEVSPSIVSQLCGDIRQFVSLYQHDHSLTGRAVARVFHGVASPNFPAQTWGRVRRFWRQFLDVDFYFIIKQATQIIVSMK